MNAIRILIVAAVALSITACSSDSEPSATAPPATTIPPIVGVQTYTGLSRNHTDADQDYPLSPPVGGDHDGAWQNCGVYDQPIRDENAVHSLEHGAVWLAYRPDLPAEEAAVVAALAVNQSHVLVSPYEGLTEAVVASAWGVQLRLESVIDPRLAQFVARYQNGVQAPEMGVTCSGAVGEPIA